MASISNYVWEDTNLDGIQDAGEAPVAGVVVNVYNSGGGLAGTDTTDAAGNYLVGDLAPGDYTVEFVPPAGRTLTGMDQGGDDALDSDPNPGTNRTGSYTLAAGEANTTVDAGLTPVTGPLIGLAKRVTAGPTENAAGNHIVEYTFIIENMGTVELSAVTLTDDFAATFLGASVVGTPTVTGGTCADAWAGAGVLAVGASCTVVIEVEVASMQPGVVYNNTATVTGTDSAGTTVDDISDDGTETDTNGNGDPADPEEGDPTPVNIVADPDRPACYATDGSAIYDSDDCPERLPYDGPYTAAPPMPPTGFEPASPTPPLVHSGSETAAFVTLSLLMLGFGGVLATGARRSRNQHR